MATAAPSRRSPKLKPGSVVRCRTRRYLVEEVQPPVEAGAATVRSSALVTSANFSENGQRYNFEAGWLVRSPWRSDDVAKHFRQMVAEGLFVRVP